MSVTVDQTQYYTG